MSKRRLRIAFLVDRFGQHFGGTESYSVELVRVLAQRHEVTIVTCDYNCSLKLPYFRIKISKIFPHWIRLLYFSWKAHCWLKHRHFDIVHSNVSSWIGNIQVTHVTPVYYKYLRNANLLRKLRVWTNLRLMAYLLLEKAHTIETPYRKLVAVSSLLSEQIHTSYGKHKTINVIPPGVQSPKIFKRGLRKAIRDELGWQKSTIGCILVARNPLRKGLLTLLHAMRQLPTDYHLLVVGANCLPRPILKRIESLQKRVHFVGPRPTVQNYFRAADICVHPTLNDSFGMVPLEAMSCGLPVIVSGPRHCGFARYLEHKRDAILLRSPQDASELSKAISCVGSNRLLYRDLVSNGLKTARSYSWKNAASRYESLYAELL